MYRVKAGQPTRAQWKLDEASGATQAEGSAGTRTLDLEGGPTLGAPGVKGTAVSLDGVDDYLVSGIPAVDTSISFSVAAWVKLDKVPDTAAVIAAQPGNNAPGFELYYSKSRDRWAFDQYTADTASATPVQAEQAAAGGVKAGQWVHLVGTYGAGANQLSLYVNGVLAGTAPYSTPGTLGGACRSAPAPTAANRDPISPARSMRFASSRSLCRPRRSATSTARTPSAVVVRRGQCSRSTSRQPTPTAIRRRR